MKNNLIFVKLMAFFLIVAVLCFALFYFLSMDIMFFIAEGSTIAAVIVLVALIFKLLFMKDIDRSLKQNPETENNQNINLENNQSSTNWICENCGNTNILGARFCNNCGNEHK